MTEVPVLIEARPLRICDVCGGYDADPRHVIAHPRDGAPPPDMTVFAKLQQNLDLSLESSARAVTDFFETTLQLRHMDCCRTAGCPDGSCYQVTAGAEDLRGMDLVAHLTKESA